ncbi:MAG TPA: histidinol dehydrogenase, partial [Azospirillum sp.]|nr:histidinol dehydrogenase [Azospirillum sp.]
MPARLDAADPRFEDGFKGLLHAKREAAEDVQAIVHGILEDVRARGDAALIEYTNRFDRQSLTADTLRVRPDEIEAALAQCGADTLAALDTAAERIEAFHRNQKPEALDYKDAAGVRLGARWTAVGAVG